MTSINPAAKRHKSSTETSPAQVSVLQNRNLVALIASFLNYEKPLSTKELTRETLTSSSACKADFRRRVLRDTDSLGALVRSDRGNFQLTCRLYRKIVLFELEMPEQAHAERWYEQFKPMVPILRNSQFDVLHCHSILKSLLKYFAYSLLTRKVKYLYGRLNPILPICQHVFDMRIQGSQNIVLTTIKLPDCDRLLVERKGFEVWFSFFLLPSDHYNRDMQTLNNLIPGNRKFLGLGIVFRKEIPPEETDSLKPVLENTLAAIQKLINSKCIHFLPTAKCISGSYFAVHVHIDTMRTIYSVNLTKPYHCIRVAASLIGAVSHLHKLRIVANQALLWRDVYIDENYWAFLSNYTALALAEEHSEQNQKLFAEDICKLMTALKSICFKAFLIGLYNQMTALEAERPTIDVVETTFIKLINENFRKPEDPKFTSLLEILKSEQLTQAE